jgi:hypothetical protein
MGGLRWPRQATAKLQGGKREPVEAEFEPGDETSEGRPAQLGEAEDIEATCLAGEDPTTDDLEDVQHWIDVYAELITATHDLVPAAFEGSEGVVKQLSRMRCHLAFWLGRRAELTSRPTDTEVP